MPMSPSIHGSVGKTLGHIIHSVQVCVPFRLLREQYLAMILEHRINPEIGIDADVIDTCSPGDFSEIASVLRQEGLSITLHGPFYDMVPGGMDKKILQATRDRLSQAFDLIPLFEPKSIVCHTGYDKKRYHDAHDQWLETAIKTWTPLVEQLHGSQTVLALENVYEKTPTMLVQLLSALDTDRAGFCFDPGHMNAFSETTMGGWLDRLGPFLRQVHLHDNDGTWDDHLAIGTGNINFEALFTHIKKYAIQPIVTLEAHQENWVWQSLKALSESAGFRRLIGLDESTLAS